MKRHAIAIVIAAAGALTLVRPAVAKSAPYDPGPQARSRITLAGPDEPGARLIVNGRVFQSDGQTPAAGVVLYVYQTDHTGHYSPRPGEPPRLRGWMKTDAAGAFEYATVRPAPYPGGRIAAHVHTQLWGGGVPQQWNRDLLFADDPALPERDRRESAAAGAFAWVCQPVVRDGVGRCTHNLRLKTAADDFEDNTRHGLDGPQKGAGR